MGYLVFMLGGCVWSFDVFIRMVEGVSWKFIEGSNFIKGLVLGNGIFGLEGRGWGEMGVGVFLVLFFVEEVGEGLIFCSVGVGCWYRFFWDLYFLGIGSR